MRQDDINILDYGAPWRAAARPGMLRGFALGWAVGVVAIGLFFVHLAHGAAPLVVMLSAGAAVTGLPAAGALALIGRVVRITNTTAFVLGIVAAPAVGLGLLVLACASYHGC